MAEETDPASHDGRPSLVPPDPYAGGGRSGPTRLLLLGLAIAVAAYVARDRLTPTPRATVAAVVPTLRPVAPAVAAATPTVATVKPPTVDAFGSIGGPDDSALASASKHDEPMPLQLQSIVIGPKRRVCMINDRPCVVGDTIGGAVLQSIGRASVVVRRAGHDLVIALPVAHP